MVLLITSLPGATELAAELARATGERVKLFADLPASSKQDALRDADILLIDEILLSEVSLDALLKRAEGATPLFVNFAICGRERLIRELRMAVRRRHLERLLAQEAAQASLRNEAKNSITGILLAAQLAIESADPVHARAKLQQIIDVALELQARLSPQAAVLAKPARTLAHPTA